MTIQYCIDLYSYMILLSSESLVTGTLDFTSQVISNQMQCECLPFSSVHHEVCLETSQFDIASSETTSQLKPPSILNFDTVRI